MELIVETFEQSKNFHGEINVLLLWNGYMFGSHRAVMSKIICEYRKSSVLF